MSENLKSILNDGESQAILGILLKFNSSSSYHQGSVTVVKFFI